MARAKVFISYSRKDEKWRERLCGQLSVLAKAGLIDLWDDRKIEAGQNWYDELNKHMGSARIAVLLISASFLTSEFILNKEITKLCSRHEQDGMTLYPLLIKPCAWQLVKWLAAMQIRPADARPLASRGSKGEEILCQVALEIATLARKKRRKRVN